MIFWINLIFLVALGAYLWPALDAIHAQWILYFYITKKNMFPFNGLLSIVRIGLIIIAVYDLNMYSLCPAILLATEV
jgi:uncharacterized membrane protein YqgA involved in biofilm formation